MNGEIVMYCAVSVATVWTTETSPREIDQLALQNPVQLNDWLLQLPKPLRLDLVENNRIQTQLLFGEPVLVKEIKGDWARIHAIWQPSKKSTKGYPGWVPLQQLSNVPLAFHNGVIRVTAAYAPLWSFDGREVKMVCWNTILPFEREEYETYIVSTPLGSFHLQKKFAEITSVEDSSTQIDMENGIELAERFLETPYLWGGLSPYGFDCSGLTFQIAKACGYQIPRDASDQATVGYEISTPHRHEWRRGDLLFFAKDEQRQKVSHVGIYFGDGVMLHSPSTGGAIEYLVIEGSKREVELCGVRRIDGKGGG